MPIKIFDTKDAVPEALRDAAIETKDGKFAVSEENTTDVTNLTSALAKEREKAKLEEKARKDAEKERDDLKRAKDAREKGISEDELQKIRDAEALARKPIVDELESTKAENRKLKLTDRVQALWLKYGGMGERSEDAMDALAKRTDLGDAGGIVVKNKDGTVSAESIDDFLKTTFKKEKPWLYVGTNGSGGGSGGSGGGRGDEGEKLETPAQAVARKRAELSGAF